jgi:oxygen-independent coproporphyrinogen-3 oxidase
VSGFRRNRGPGLALEPENITVHTLALKRGSRITLEGGQLPTAPEVGAMLDFRNAALRRAGYAPYYLYRQKFMSGGFENVGWTKPGHINLYNICIMEELCSILAMGGGGSTKLTPRLTAKTYASWLRSIRRNISNILKRPDDKKHIKEFYNGLSAF